VPVDRFQGLAQHIWVRGSKAVYLAAVVQDDDLYISIFAIQPFEVKRLDSGLMNICGAPHIGTLLSSIASGGGGGWKPLYASLHVAIIMRVKQLIHGKT